MADAEAAAFALVHARRGRARELAQMIGLGEQVLLNKVNPTNDRNHLMLRESVALQIGSGDHRIFFAEADELGYMVVKLPECDDADIGQASMRAVKEFGDFIGRVEEALRDGSVSKNELRAIEQELIEAQAHIMRLHQLVAGKVKQK